MQSVVISESFRTEWTPRLLSVLRIVVALLFLQHGLTKLFGFPGAAPANFHWFTLAPGLASLIETFGSVALLFGFYTRVAAFIMSGEMASTLPWPAAGNGAWTQNLPKLSRRHRRRFRPRPREAPAG
jgi:uncharacterized membrane protein YphA (DoxX/SURF4 family)